LKNIIFYGIALLIFAVSWLSGKLFWTSFGLAFTGYIFLKLLDDLGRTIPIVELMTSLASLQWILGPVIEYGREEHHFKYYMYVGEREYMAFVVPAVLAFWIGAGLFKRRISLDDIKLRIDIILHNHPMFPYILIAAGIIAPFLSGFFPQSLKFVFFLVSNIKYVGVIYLIHSTHRFRWHIFIGVLILAVGASLASGMFHDLLLWSMLLFTFLAKELKLNLGWKISSVVIGILVVMTIQAVKTEYREYAWGGYQGNRFGLFLRIAGKEWGSGDIFLPSKDENMNIRLNQGWIISAIMYNVPANVPFAQGETIKDALTASFLPRFIYPDKPIAGGRANFRKFTSLSINDNTSMGISIAGEGYANFGKLGGYIFMFFWGLFIGWFWRQLENLSRLFPTLLVWSPILFLQVVKAETELTVVLNHLIKSSIVVFGLIWGIKMIWGERWESEEEEGESVIRSYKKV